MKTIGIGMVGARYGARMHHANFQKLPMPASISLWKSPLPATLVNRVIRNPLGSMFPVPVCWKERCRMRMLISASKGSVWNRPSADEDWFRGFLQEITDFAEAIRDDHEPQAGIDLAVDCVNVIYSAYLSAEEGRRIIL